MALVLLFAAVALGGGTTPAVQAAFFLALGGWLLVRPGLVEPFPGFAVGGGLLLGWVWLSALPLGLTPGALWREVLAGADLALPASLSPQPWVTLEGSLFVVAGLAGLAGLAQTHLGPRGRRALLKGFAVGGVLLAAGLAVAEARGYRHPLVENPQVFSYFPNRNQTSTFLAMGAVVAFGLSFIRFRKDPRQALPWLAALVILLYGLLQTLSRGGLLAFFGGCLAWLILTASAESGGKVARLAPSLILLLFTIFAFWGGRTRDRLLDTLESLPAGGGDFRVEVYRDTLRFSADGAGLGVGLGNFEALMPQYRRDSHADIHLRHPESDWLWWAAELGWPGLLLLLALLLAALRTAWPGSGSSLSLHRSTAFSAVLVFFLHSLTDVGAHRLGTAWAALLLFWLALPDRGASLPRRKSFPLLGRLAGALLVLHGLAAGAGLLGADLPWPPRTLLERAPDRAGPADAGVAWADRCARWVPLAWQPYFLRAQWHLRQNRWAEAEVDFRRVRLLERVSPELPWQEGRALADRRPALALAAWREALRRAGPEDEERWFRAIQRACRDLPEPYREEGPRRLSRLSPRLRLSYLTALPNPPLAEEFAAERRADPALAAYAPDQREALLRHLVEHGLAREVLDLLAQLPDSMPSPWRVRARALAETGDFAAACALAEAELPVPLRPLEAGSETMTQLQLNFYSDPTNFSFGTRLLRRQLGAGDWVAALRTAERLAELPAPPPFVTYWRASLLNRLQRPAEAWPHWRRYLDLAPPAP